MRMHIIFRVDALSYAHILTHARTHAIVLSVSFERERVCMHMWICMCIVYCIPMAWLCCVVYTNMLSQQSTALIHQYNPHFLPRI